MAIGPSKSKHVHGATQTVKETKPSSFAGCTFDRSTAQAATVTGILMDGAWDGSWLTFGSFPLRHAFPLRIGLLWCIRWLMDSCKISFPWLYGLEHGEVRVTPTSSRIRRTLMVHPGWHLTRCT